jgi:hypothetical protein
MKLSTAIRQTIGVKNTTPHEFCMKWLPKVYPDLFGSGELYYDTHGLRQYAIRLLMDTLKLSYPTVNAWGKKFEKFTNKDQVIWILASHDFINETFEGCKQFAAQERG